MSDLMTKLRMERGSGLVDVNQTMRAAANEIENLRAALTTAEAERDAAQDELADYDHTLLMKLDPSAAGSTDLFTWGTCLIKQRDRARQEAAAAKAEAEHERMRLSACGVAAMMNTPETVMQRLSRDHPCWSASYGDVCNAVDREMEARKSLARLQQEREGLIAAIENIRLSAASALSYGHQATQKDAREMVERKELRLRDILRFCEKAGVAGSPLRAPTRPTETQEPTR